MSATVDEEIRAVQERIAHRRLDLSDAGVQLADNLKVRVASPRALLIAAAGGFIAGLAALRMRDAKRDEREVRASRDDNRRERTGRRRTDRILMGEEARRAGKLGALGMLAGWGLTMARARQGGSPPMMLARMLLSRFRRH